MFYHNTNDANDVHDAHNFHDDWFHNPQIFYVYLDYKPKLYFFWLKLSAINVFNFYPETMVLAGAPRPWPARTPPSDLGSGSVHPQHLGDLPELRVVNGTQGDSVAALPHHHIQGLNGLKWTALRTDDHMCDMLHSMLWLKQDSLAMQGGIAEKNTS